MYDDDVKASARVGANVKAEAGDARAPVHAALDGLGSRINDVAKMVETVRDRLKPVLSGSVPKDEVRGPGLREQMPSELSPLAERIASEADNLTDVIDMLSDLMARIEV